FRAHKIFPVHRIPQPEAPTIARSSRRACRQEGDSMVAQRHPILPTALAVATFLALNLTGQVTTGRIFGSVLDPSEATVSNAVVTARSLETNAERKAITNREGWFDIPELPVGSYEITVEKAGFAKYVQGPIVLRVSENADLRIELSLASVTDKVTVSDDAPLLNTANAEVGANYDRRRISELPLGPNHNVDKLALSVAGVNPFQNGQNSVIMPNATVVFSVDGGRVRSNNFTIDGQDVNNIHLGGEDQRLNNPDTIAEFRLVTNQVAPEFGQGMGGIVSIITKSGGNEPH